MYQPITKESIGFATEFHTYLLANCSISSLSTPSMLALHLANEFSILATTLSSVSERIGFWKKPEVR